MQSTRTPLSHYQHQSLLETERQSVRGWWVNLHKTIWGGGGEGGTGKVAAADIAASATATGASKEPGAAGVAVKKEAGRSHRGNGCGTRCGSLADEGVDEGKDEFTLKPV